MDTNPTKQRHQTAESNRSMIQFGGERSRHQADTNRCFTSCNCLSRLDGGERCALWESFNDDP